jgi:hypothetical protein
MTKMSSRISVYLLALAAAGALFGGGCTQGEQPRKDPDAKDAAAAKDKPKGEHTHDEWWCKEHGIPEDECTICRATPNSRKLAAECKAKGDWCKKHKRALSQCFLCNPKRQEFYAAKYRAKYGKEPPPTEE